MLESMKESLATIIRKHIIFLFSVIIFSVLATLFVMENPKAHATNGHQGVNNYQER